MLNSRDIRKIQELCRKYYCTCSFCFSDNFFKILALLSMISFSPDSSPIILYYVILYYITLYHIALYYIILYHIILHYIALYHIILYYIILYYIILYYITLYYIISEVTRLNAIKRNSE